MTLESLPTVTSDAEKMPRLKAIRLVIWDLDGTFWSGTLTEGGHTYSLANHDIIIELAKRGIVSSICSKNDFETVKAILIEKGIWNYILFPSISWSPKGPRLRQLFADVQLGPETILLLDDNPLNLREADHFVPGIQTADERFIPEILTSPFFKSKNDPEFSRLKEYRLLQTRKAVRLQRKTTQSSSAPATFAWRLSMTWRSIGFPGTALTEAGSPARAEL